MLDHGFLKLPATQSLQVRIGLFHDFLSEKIKQHCVTTISLEAPFLGKNAQTFLKLGYLRGILYLLAQPIGAIYYLGLLLFLPRLLLILVEVSAYPAANRHLPLLDKDGPCLILDPLRHIRRSNSLSLEQLISYEYYEPLSQ